jgi:diaminohydroxyphosphoribosylaminopyrimidine deaminase/5-amino-6-(5-phosphoribosylamino)uracil reductase
MLGQRSVMSVIAEGGPTLLASLFAEGHVDEVHAYVAPVILGPDALTLFRAEPSFDAATLRAVGIEPLAPDVLIRGYTGSWSPS